MGRMRRVILLYAIEHRNPALALVDNLVAIVASYENFHASRRNRRSAVCVVGQHQGKLIG